MRAQPGRPRARSASRAVALLPLVALLALLVAAPVAGHASLLSSVPMQGANLEQAPERVSVTLTEPVDPAGTSLQVLDAAGLRVDLGGLEVTPDAHAVVSVRLPADLPAGGYTMVWRALSRTDGHPTGGSVGFAIGAHSAPEGSTQTGWTTGSALARGLSYAGFSLAFGAAAFLLWMRPLGYPAATGRVALLAGATLHAAGAVLLMAHFASGTGIPVTAVGASSIGQFLLLRVGLGGAAWLLALVWAFRPVAGGPAVVTAILAASALASARVGHAYAHGYSAMAMDFIHLVSATAWVGGLALFLHHVWGADRQGRSDGSLRAFGVRFGTFALVAVLLLVASGLVTSLSILGPAFLADPSGWDAGYVAILAAKVLLSLAMVGVAAVNRFVVLAPAPPRALAAVGRWLRPHGTAGALRRLVAVEAAFGAVVLVLAGFLTSVPPPQAEPDGFVTVEGQGAHYLVVAETPQPRAGALSEIHLSITALEDGKAVVSNTCGRPTGCIQLELTYPGYDAPQTYTAYPAGGLWMVHDAIWTQPGPVEARVLVQTAEHFLDEVPLLFHVED